jgi:hypothetical protein
MLVARPLAGSSKYFIIHSIIFIFEQCRRKFNRSSFQSEQGKNQPELDLINPLQDDPLLFDASHLLMSTRLLLH